MGKNWDLIESVSGGGGGPTYSFKKVERGVFKFRRRKKRKKKGKLVRDGMDTKTKETNRISELLIY